MTDRLYHRGPDGSGYSFWQSNEAHLGLGHRRLSIIDLSPNGKQPMQHNDLCITYNGEIYNYAEVKVELEKRGHHFLSESDTEVILHAYEEWGNNCLEKFIGMFAFVIYDKQRETLFCARDRTGIKPFFYYYHEGLFLFGSELKSIVAHPAFEKKLNLQAVGTFLQYGNIPTPLCIYEHCYKLKPGHFLQVDLHTKATHGQCYWNVYDYYNQPISTLDFEESKRITCDLLISASNYRMVADVPIGVFLSGGYDSACVTALLQKERTEKIKTFTISVPDIGLNEAPYAKKVADFLGTDHTEIAFTQREALELIASLPEIYDEPFGDSSALPTILVSKAARHHVTVALSADGGDEVFAGYNRYDYLIRYGTKINQIPGVVRNMMAGVMEQIPSSQLPYLRNKYNFHNRYEKLKGILRNPAPETIMKSLSEQYTWDQVQKMMKTEASSYPPTAYFSKELKQNSFSPLRFMMAIDYQTYLVDDILQKVDRATMSASLEGREPLLDHRIIEWAATLPDAFKYKNGEKKYILKEIVHDLIPKSLMERPKMGFAIPIGDWLRNELRPTVDEFLNEADIVAQGIFDWPQIAQLKHDFFKGKKEFDVKIWYFLMFQMWYAKWMK